MKSTVNDVMSTHVIAVSKGAPFKEMAARLREFRVSAFPVVDDDNKVIGVVSEADLLTKEALEGGQAGMPGMISGILALSRPTVPGQASIRMFIRKGTGYSGEKAGILTGVQRGSRQDGGGILSSYRPGCARDKGQ
jgi:CBS domain-containing protein